MFCITLQWWLGNQLFQYAFWQMLAKHYNTKVVYDDLNYSAISIFSIGCALWIRTPRTLELERFAIQLDRPTRIQRIQHWSTGIHKIAQKVWRKNKYAKNEVNPYQYDESRLMLDSTNNYLCTGYRNVAKYYEWIKGEISKHIVLKHESNILKSHKSNIQALQNSGKQVVSIHIRGGDYIKLGMVVCDEHYYKNALESLKKTYGKDALHIYLFSDDPDNLPIDIWFLKEYDFTQIIFDDYYKHKQIDQWGFDDVEKFMLMKECNDFIIANSTYSRRSAWLSTKNWTVYAPKTWLFNTKSNEIVDKKWILI